MGNFLMLLFVAVVGIGVTLVSYYRMKNETPARNYEQGYTMHTLLNRVKYKLADLTKETDDIYALDDDEYEAIYARRSRVLNALKNCVYCIDEAKTIVKELIREEICLALPEERDIANVINFSDRYLEARIKFEIILYFYKKKHGKNALAKWIKENEIDQPKPAIDGLPWQKGYYVTEEDIDRIYRNLDYKLTYDTQIDILTVLIYQEYKGLGIVDTIRELNIDGLNLGVSGSILSNIASGMDTGVATPIEATKSVWVQFSGKYIHFKFLDFKRMSALKKIATTIISYNSPGALTEKTGFIVNTMPDKTRVLAMRPPVGSYWGVFCRKFTLSNNKLTYLLNPLKEVVEDGVIQMIPRYMNTKLPEELASWLMRAKINTAVTGRQSSGKTTTMKALVQYIDPCLNIRVIETAPEMYLRELYQHRNIFEAQEFGDITTTNIQNAFKKSDGGVLIVGEVANAEMAARMIEAAKVASEVTIFSSHHKTSRNLVQMLRNDLVTIVPGTPAHIAEALVVDALPIDYHQDFESATGERFIDRVTEIIALSEGIPYPEVHGMKLEEVLKSFTEIFREYAMRSTDRSSFTTRDIMVFDRVERRYKAANVMSAELIEHIISNLNAREAEEFRQFIIKYWYDRKEENIAC